MDSGYDGATKPNGKDHKQEQAAQDAVARAARSDNFLFEPVESLILPEDREEPQEPPSGLVDRGNAEAVAPAEAKEDEPRANELEAETGQAAAVPASGVEGDSTSEEIAETSEEAKAPPASHNVFSSAVFLMSRSAKHQHLFLADLEWRLMPPLALKQFRIFTKDNLPIGLATWALVSEEVEARLKTGEKRLKPQEWKCGTKLVLIDLVAPFGGAKSLLKELKHKVSQDLGVLG